jgi:hypothetical protein
MPTQPYRREFELLKILLHHLRELETELKSILPSLDDIPRTRLVEALSFMEKADHEIQGSLKPPTRPSADPHSD